MEHVTTKVNVKKIHPKTCKNFTTDQSCWFKKSCAHFHPEPSELDKNIIISEMQVKLECLECTVKEKVAQLQNTTKGLSEKVEMLDSQLAVLENTKAKSVKETSSEGNQI